MLKFYSFFVPYTYAIFNDSVAARLSSSSLPPSVSGNQIVVKFPTKDIEAAIALCHHLGKGSVSSPVPMALHTGWDIDIQFIDKDKNVKTASLDDDNIIDDLNISISNIESVLQKASSSGEEVALEQIVDLQPIIKAVNNLTGHPGEATLHDDVVIKMTMDFYLAPEVSL